MNRLSPIGLCVVLSVFSGQGWAETVVPMKGQNSQQTQLDINECNSIAASSTSTTSTPSGGRVKGAVAGAAPAGAAAAGRARRLGAAGERLGCGGGQGDHQRDS